MGLNKTALGRYKVIDGLLRNSMRRYPTMDDIIEACEQKLDYIPSRETIQKDISFMKRPFPEGFDAPIQFNRVHQGYQYTDPDYTLSGVTLQPEERDALNEAVEVIRAIGGSRISDKFSHVVEKILSASLESSHAEQLPILQTMIPPRSRGYEYFDLLYAACKEHIPVSFIHFSYQSRQFKHVLLHPFLIKEFDNRWYVIGYSEKHEAARAFGFDRISFPYLVKKAFVKVGDAIKKDYLQNIYGVYPLRTPEVETVGIGADELITQYFQAYPIHESQQMVKRSSGRSTITLHLIPSMELARFILSHGNHISIREPLWFREQVLNLRR